MNLTKKILSVILSVFLVATVFGVCASAEGTANGNESMTVTVSTDQDVYSPGDVVTVHVSLKTNYNMTTFRFPIMFNSSVFEIPNLINLTALNTCRSKGTLVANSLNDGKFIPEEYDASEFSCILVQWTANVSDSTLGCLNLPEGEECFTFNIKAKSSAAGMNGTIFIPSEYTGFYNQAVQNPADATSIYYLDASTFTKDFISKTVSIEGETADLVPNAGYDSTAVVDKENMVVYGLDVGLSTTAELRRKVMVTGAGTMKVEFAEYGLGTGSRINVVVDDTVVKTYSIVIFGDVNGDAVIDVNDKADLRLATLMIKDYENPAVNMAADVNGDGNLDTLDLRIVNNVINMITDLDQANPY